MRIAEVKNGEVRLAENRIAAGGSSVSVNGRPERERIREPDFTDYLSEKDRRRWDRLADSRKERILRKAERCAVVSETIRTAGDDGYIRPKEDAFPSEPVQDRRYDRVFSVRQAAEYRDHKDHRDYRGYRNTVRGLLINTALTENSPEYEPGKGAENEIGIAVISGSSPERKKTPARPGINTGEMFRQDSKGPVRRERGNPVQGTSIRQNSGPRQTTAGPRVSSVSSTGPPVTGGSRIKNRAASDIKINTPSSGSGGVVGLAASAARKTASKVSGALRDKADMIAAGDAAKNLEDYEKASDEVKKVTGPVKKIAAALFAMLSLILGPLLFVIIMVIILVVVIIFLVAWLISVLIPVVTASASPAPMGGTGLMPYYCQQDERWAAYPFNGNSISTDGCGMTSMAMIMACLTGDMTIIPPTIVDTGYNTVLSHGAPTGIASEYGITDIEQMGGPSLNCCGVRGYDEAYLKEKIAEGCPVLVSVTGSYLGVTTSGHYIVLYGQGENGVYVYDPATLGRIYQESISGGGSDWNDTIHGAKHIWIFPAPEIRVEGDSNAERIFNYLVRCGWSKAAAAGAVGNFYQEAGGGGTADINPGSYDSGSWGEAGGIAGFTDNSEAGNFTGLKDFASQRGKDWTDLQTQCDYLIYQLSHGKWWGAYDTPTYTQMAAQGYSVPHMTYEEFTQLTDVDEAVKAFLCFYEDCGYRMAHYEDVRLPMAMQAYAAWGSGTQRSERANSA